LQTTDADGTGSRSNIIPFNQPLDEESDTNNAAPKDQYYFTFFKDNPEAAHRLHTTNPGAHEILALRQ
jgi:hypothetical protein